jgi:hypothetical protein
MNSRRLTKYRNRLRSKVPLLAGWLKGHAVNALAEEASAEAVGLLADTAQKYQGSEVGRSASRHLERLAAENNLAAREALCGLVMINGHAEASRVVQERRYVPHDETRRALFYFLTHNWDEYEKLDFNHRLLRTSYERADAALRRRIGALARQAGRLEWVDVVTQGRRSRRLGLMTGDEWRATLSILENGERWEDLWHLAQEAPAIWGAALLRAMRRPGGTVPAQDTALLAELGPLARSWKEANLAPYFHSKRKRKAHAHEVRCLTVSKDGKVLASGSADRTVRLWALPQLAPLKVLKGHKSWVNGVVFSWNSKLVAGAGRDGLVCIWRTARAAVYKGCTATKKPLRHSLSVPTGPIW